jgi:hypothetical protein
MEAFLHAMIAVVCDSWFLRPWYGCNNGVPGQDWLGLSYVDPAALFALFFAFATSVIQVMLVHRLCHL